MREGITLEEVVRAYRTCLKGKRGTVDALRFEWRAEEECINLWREYNTRTYRPSRSIVFISHKPVQREIFGSAFRDRVIDTVIAQKLTPIVEKMYIDDNYSTRVGKGTLYGLRRVEQMVRECSHDYTCDCYIMKLDIQSYFMSLPKDLLFQKMERMIRRYYHEPDIELLLWNLHVIIMDRPELHCVRKSRRSAWHGLPRNKSLFYSDGMHGVPIGKVISQMSALVFLDDLDHLIKGREGMKYYGHYMDDMLFVHPSKERLLQVKEVVAQWLEQNQIRLHPKKLHLQHYKKGVLFCGGMIMPGRSYLSNRTGGNCLTAVERFNRQAQEHPAYAERHVDEFCSTMNSYFGMMQHFSEWKLTHRIIRKIDPRWFQVMNVHGCRGRYKTFKTLKIEN